jgi:hypothetical protein
MFKIRPRLTPGSIAPSSWAVLSALALLSVGSPIRAKPGSAPAAKVPWQTEKIQGEKRALPKGKTLLSVSGPGKRYTLLFRDEGEHGDFFWRSVYLQQGHHYTVLQSCNQLRKVHWDAKPLAVRYEADVAVGPDRMERSLVEYRLGAKTLRRRLITTMKVQASG